jgi:hypothetical protein
VNAREAGHLEAERNQKMTKNYPIGQPDTKPGRGAKPAAPDKHSDKPGSKPSPGTLKPESNPKRETGSPARKTFPK